MSENIRATLVHGRVAVGFSMMDILGHVIIWTVISIVTFGIGFFFWPYAASKLILNSITLYDSADNKIGKLHCNLSAGQQIGHIILWIIISVVTFGLAVPFYFFGVVRTAIDQTEIV